MKSEEAQRKINCVAGIVRYTEDKNENKANNMRNKRNIRVQKNQRENDCCRKHGGSSSGVN